MFFVTHFFHHVQTHPSLPNFLQVKYWFQRQRRNRKHHGDALTAFDGGSINAASPRSSDVHASSSKPTFGFESNSENDLEDEDEDGEGIRPLKIDLDALPEYDEGEENAAPSPTPALTVDVQSPLRIRIKSPSAAFPRFPSHQLHASSSLPDHLLSSPHPQSPTASASSPSILTPTSEKRKGARRDFSRDVLIELWTVLIRHKKHPHPTLEVKQRLANSTGLTLKQVTKWFLAARNRQYLNLKSSMDGLEDFIDEKYGLE